MFNVSYDVMAFAALVSAMAAVLLAFSTNARLRGQLERQQDSIKALRADLNAVCAGAVSVGEHLARLEQRAHQLVQRQDQIEMHEPSNQSYRHAVKMLHKGAQLEEVMTDCGLGRGEAELIALSQRLDKAS
jgi:hypothetical protein